MGVQWLSGKVLDLRLRGCGFEPHRCHCVVSLSKNINPSLVLVQPRKTRPFITERLLMGRKESNKTKQIKVTMELCRSNLSMCFWGKSVFSENNTCFHVMVNNFTCPSPSPPPPPPPPPHTHTIQFANRFFLIFIEEHCNHTSAQSLRAMNNMV